MEIVEFLVGTCLTVITLWWGMKWLKNLGVSIALADRRDEKIIQLMERLLEKLGDTEDGEKTA